MIKRVLLICVLAFSCKSIPVQNETQTTTTQSLSLGMIGEDKLFILEEDYNSIAIPIYKEQIKISASLVDFNKSSFKAFKKANSNKAEPLQIDTLSTDTKFLKLEIADRVAILNTLNEDQNEDVKKYLINKKDAHIISAVSIALDNEKLKFITEADALFLKQESHKTYVIKVYKNNQIVTSLSFNDGVVFAYQSSSFCWKENDRRQLEIVDLVESTDKCPNTTYRSAKRAKNKVDYFKF
jgi:hypothetical protein